MENVSSEQELLDLRRDGKVTEDEYRQLLDAMRKPAPNDSTKPISIRRKYVLLIALAVAIIAGILFVTSATSNVDDTEEISVPDKPAQERIVDKIDYPFINDPEIIGTWKSVDFVQAIDDFRAGKKHWPGDLFLKDMIFFDEGRTGGPWTWTEGLIMHPGDKTAAKYHIQEINDEKYMFFEWKSGDYIIRPMKPRYYVLQKVIEMESAG